jgi:SAM-dependent methyltransferase
MRPWHHDIQITDDLSTGEVFDSSRRLQREENRGISLISPRAWFVKRMQCVFPDGLSGKRFLDCACNAGAFCFFARELDADYTLGFDIRPKWIEQARFVQKHRNIAPTDRIDFEVFDLFELPQRRLEHFDVTNFSGIFYHLPDPIHGLKLAADLTRDILLINTAALHVPNNPRGMTPVGRKLKKLEHRFMSGVYSMAWLPHGPETLSMMLRWLGFNEIKLTRRARKSAKRDRLEIAAAREPGRLANLPGQSLS